jgi:hypothetical protein
MAAKALLPLLGGSAGVWTVSLVFYQTVLLGGYAFAHWLVRRFSLRTTAALHTAVVCAATAFLPWHGPGTSGLDRLPPSLWVLGALASSIGVPFFALAATGPLLQRWFVAGRGSRDPYRLYALSNAGSLGALLAYPWAIERYLPLAPATGIAAAGGVGISQQSIWSFGFIAFAALVAACAAITLRAFPGGASAPPAVARSRSGNRTSEAPEAVRSRAAWLGLSAVPAAVMLGTTQAIATDVASIPLLWVIPLALYLASFVVAFALPGRALLRTAAVAVTVLVPAIVAAQWTSVRPDPHITVPLYLATLFAVGVLCHARLAAQRPPSTDLTLFYLFVAAGGAVGGLLCGLVAPLVFRSIAEFPLALVAACLALPPWHPSSRSDGKRPMRTLRGFGTFWPALFGAIVAALFLAAAKASPLAGHDLFAVRTFYGVLRVKDEPGLPFVRQTGPQAGKEVRLPMHELYHGTTLHGVQMSRPGQPHLPTTYYHPSGPIGRLFASLRASAERSALLTEVGIVGLGVGSLAAYAKPGERFTFFEMDPAVVRIARDPTLFTFLSDCAGTTDVVVGDGRVSLTSQPDERFGLLVVDAFSSDTVPVHLLTREFVALALRKIRTGGLVAFLLSTTFFDLSPVVAEAVASLGTEGLYWHDRELSTVEIVTAKLPSTWIVAARTPADLDVVAKSGPWASLSSQRRATGGPWLWTDLYSSPLAALHR